MLKKFLILVIVVVVLFFGWRYFSQGASGPVRKIVVFDTSVLNEAALEGLAHKHGGNKVLSLPNVNGAAIVLPNEAAAKGLGGEVGVVRVEDDILVTAFGLALGKPVSAQPPQSLPWGVDRIDAELAWGTATGDVVKLAVIDTGIQLNHPDLQTNIKGGANFTTAKNYDDDNGHGTHVAGIVGALSNAIGVVGVAPAADLYAVKVLDRNGSGYLSWVIAGLNWAAQNGMQVANMSLGTSSYSATFEQAVKNAYAAGLVIVAAAGNANGGAVGYPAKFAEVIAVSATTSSDTLASFSSVGPEVDFSAPGASIYSTYKGSTYKTLSGTSMASPHVAGTVALVLSVPVGAWDANLNGVWDESEVRAKLQATVWDLGAAGFDNQFGWGLVNAFGATQ